MAIYLGILNDGTFVTSDGYILQDTHGTALYAIPASDKWKIIINNEVYRLNIGSNLTLKEAD